MKLYKDYNQNGSFNLTTTVGALIAELLKLDQRAFIYSEGCDCTGNVVEVKVEDDGSIMLCRDGDATDMKWKEGKYDCTVAKRYKDRVADLPDALPDYVVMVISYEDRRVLERQVDGSKIIRDPVTDKAWRMDGTPLPDGLVWTSEEPPAEDDIERARRLT